MIFNMNFEQPPVSTEKIELPPDLIKIAKKGLEDAEVAHTTFSEVAKAMVKNGMDNSSRQAYLKILEALSHLKQDQGALENYLH